MQEKDSAKKFDTDRWRRIAGVVEVALELDAGTRAAYLEALGREDEDLRRRVLGVLRSMGAIGLADEMTGVGVDSSSTPTGEGVDGAEDRIGPWRLVRLLGRGGMGAVFLAERDDAEYQRRAAIKMIGGSFPSPTVYRRFLAERQILATFDHPHIAKLFDGGTAKDGRPYLVMEYVDGVPVDRFCFDRGLSLDGRLRLFQKICSAVAYAHRQLVVHRDLKPTNILVGADGEPKLLDFGIAKILEPEALLPFEVEATRTTQAVMTPSWASPEQLRGGAISTSSDVYSLGLLLFKLLTGILPPRGAKALGEESGEITTRPSRVLEDARGEEEWEVGWEESNRRQTARQLRGDLDNIVMKALRPEPEKRYPSVAALAEDLQRYAGGRPVKATRDTPFYVAGKFFLRYRWQMVAALLFFVSVLGAAGVALLQAERLRQERDQTQVARERAEAQAQRAERQASRAEGSLQFLGDLLRAADETERLQEDLSVRDLLVEGLERLEGGAVEAPEAKVDLLELLGDSFLDFRELPLSVKAYKLAYETAESHRLPEEKRASLLSSVARMQIITNDQADIEETCLALIKTTSKEANHTRLRCFGALEYLAWYRGDIAKVVRLRRAKIQRQLRAEPMSTLSLQIMVTWGELHSVGWLTAQEAETYLEGIARLALSDFPEKSRPVLLKTTSFLQTAKTELGKVEEALRIRQWQVAHSAQSHGHDTVAADRLMSLARTYRDVGELDRALELIAEAEVMARNMLEIDAQDLRAQFTVSQIPYVRSTIWRRLGQGEREREELELSYERFRPMGAAVPGNFLFKKVYVSVLMRLGRLQEAEPLVQELVDKGHRWKSFLELAGEKGLLPDPLPPIDFDKSIAPEIEARFPGLGHIPLPWNVMEEDGKPTAPPGADPAPGER